MGDGKRVGLNVWCVVTSIALQRATRDASRRVRGDTVLPRPSR